MLSKAEDCVSRLKALQHDASLSDEEIRAEAWAIVSGFRASTGPKDVAQLRQYLAGLDLTRETTRWRRTVAGAVAALQ